MRKLDILIKSITLLYREKLVGELMHIIPDMSVELVKNVVKTLESNTKSNQLTGGDSTIVDDLKYLVMDFYNNPDNHDQLSLLQSLEIILKDKPNLIKVVDKSINTEIQLVSLKRSIVTLRNNLLNYHKEQNIKSLVSQAGYKLSVGSLGVDSMSDFVNKLVANLEALSTNSKTKDPAIVDELDVGDEGTMSEILDRVKETTDDSDLLKSGWTELNNMVQGGFRKGEFAMISALQHKYKSGFVQSLFMQLAMHNVPKLKDKDKKPLIIYLSLEDDVEIFTSFMYKYLYNNENNKLPRMDTVTGRDIANYIKVRLGRNGYHVKLLRINPNDYDYKRLTNKMLEYEADGYELHAVFIDYLSKLNTNGMVAKGGFGVDIRELYDKTRNFFSSRGTLCVTPHQLSTEAAQLIKNGVPNELFLEEVAGKNYTADSKQLSQVVDLELYLHIANIDRKPNLFVRRGKHRRANILDEKYLQFHLPFPYRAPIRENINDTPSQDPSDDVEDTTDEFGF